MKLIILTLTALLSLGSFQSKAQDVKVSTAVVNAFNAAFKNTTEVQWKESGAYYKADFTMNGQFINAYYDQNANLVAVTKNISTVQLPVTLQAKLKQTYSDYWVSDLFELSDESGTSYYVTVENGDTKTTLKSVSNDWTKFKKQNKS